MILCAKTWYQYEARNSSKCFIRLDLETSNGTKYQISEGFVKETQLSVQQTEAV